MLPMILYQKPSGTGASNHQKKLIIEKLASHVPTKEPNTAGISSNNLELIIEELSDEGHPVSQLEPIIEESTSQLASPTYTLRARTPLQSVTYTPGGTTVTRAGPSGQSIPSTLALNEEYLALELEVDSRDLSVSVPSAFEFVNLLPVKYYGILLSVRLKYRHTLVKIMKWEDIAWRSHLLLLILMLERMDEQRVGQITYDELDSLRVELSNF